MWHQKQKYHHQQPLLHQVGMLNAKAWVLPWLLADDETDNVTMMMMPHECDNIAWMRHGMANEPKSLSEHHETSAAAL